MARDSLGVQRLAFRIETEDVPILVALGTSLGPRRGDLSPIERNPARKPHPEEIQAAGELRGGSTCD